MIEGLTALMMVWILYQFIKALLTPNSKEAEESNSKVDITNLRQTRFKLDPTLASYKPTRKSAWSSPLKKVDVIDYEIYIQSDEWIESSARRSKLITTNGRCECCGANNGTHVHHITYRNLGKESVKDLSVLCPACHDYTHKMAGKGAGYYPPLQCPSTK